MNQALFRVGESRRPFPLPDHPTRGTVYGAALNHRPLLDRLGAALEEAPYKGAPKAPVLYIKPQNTLRADGAVVTLPQGADMVEIGATLAVVIGRSATAVSVADALDVVAGYTIAADLSLPHASYYRPAIREKCFDGACPLGADVVAPAVLGDPATVTIKTVIDGQAVHAWSLADLVRPLPQLIAEVSAFMTLRPGDILLVGVANQAAQAKIGQQVTVEIPTIGQLEFSIADAADAAAPKGDAA